MSAESSSEEPELCVRDVFAMDTFMHLKAYGEHADTTLGKAIERILLLEDKLSVKSEQSDTWAINHSDGKAVSVSKDTMTLLRKGIEIGEKTNGALDITLYPVITAWGFTMDKQQIPDTQLLADRMSLVDYTGVLTDGDLVSVPDGMQVDFGALAKGYTSDCVIEILKKNDVNSALVNLGGNVHALGSKPDGSFWKVGVQNPFFPSEQICTLDISDMAVITSGNYERYFTGSDGKKYWHIIDPKDGYPADNGLVSVTIIGKSGLVSDALSTALFVLGTEEAIRYWQEEEGFEMILVTDDAKLYYTEGLTEFIQISKAWNANVIFRE